MMILDEQILTLSQAAKRLPRLRGNRPVAVSTLWRWCQRGLRGVRLEVIRLGGIRVTSEEALRRFFAILNQPQGHTDDPSPQESLAQIEQNLSTIGF